MTHEGEQERNITYLPEESGEVDSPNRGRWEPIRELMTKLSSGLKVPKEASADALTAIPTVWARPILFAEALTEKNHPLHNEILAEWRGLLGLFCFKNAYGWKINPKRYPIKENSVQQLERILYELSPSKEWLVIHLIYLEDTLIAGTSPLSLFFTPSEYRCPESIDWRQKNGRLGDPTKYLKPDSVELYVLKKWIEKTRNNVASSQFNHEETKNKLLGVFNDWLGEIKPNISIERVEFTKPIIDENPYQLASYVSSYEQPVWSDFFLKCKIKERPPIVVVKELWERDGIVYPPHKASNIAFNKIPQKLEGKVKEIFEAIKYDGIYLRPEYLFTEKILELSLFQENVVPSHKDYVIPLRQEIINFFEPEDLEELVSWEDVKGGGLKTTLRLPLETQTKSNKFVEVSHFYTPDQVVKISRNPVLELWPNFQADGWKLYYCLYQWEGSSFSCEPYPKSGKPVKHASTMLWKMDNFPKAMICYDLQGKPIGLIPIKQPQKLGQTKTKWTVSVDFGTSNTCLFFRTSADTPPARLEFNDRCLRLTNAPNEIRSLFLYTFFFPPSLIDGIFPSHLRMLQPSSSPEPMIDGVLLFVEPIQWMKSLENLDLYENLKWSMDQSRRSYIATFLKQILLMIMAEARFKGVKDLELRYSYPSAFTKGMKRDLKDFWDSILGIRDASGIEVNISPSSPETESSCICKHLVKERAAPRGAESRPQVVVDIGGGTTDVAIWMKNSLQVQTSLLLAGNEISKYAREKSEFRKKIQGLLKDVKIDDKAFKEHPAAILNILLQLYDEKISEPINTTEKHSPEIKRAREIIFLMASGVFYYNGILLRYLASNGAAIDSCDVYLAGNGARLLRWCLGKDYKPLAEILKSGAGSTLSLQEIIIHSTDKYAKEEVARGLLYEYSAGESIKESVIILGERGYKSDGEEISWNSDICKNSEKLKTLTVPEKFYELETFIKAFNDQTDDLSLERIVVVPSRIKARIEHAVKQYQQEEQNILFQPFFIEEVRAVLSDLF